MKVKEVVVKSPAFGEASWADGTFYGSGDVVARAGFAAEHRLEVPYACNTFIAGQDTPLGAFAALASIDPEGTELVFAPRDVADAVEAREDLRDFDLWGVDSPHLAMLAAAARREVVRAL